MIIYSKCIAGGRGIAKPLIQRAAVITLDWDTRQKSRFEATDSKGQTVGVFLPRGQVVRGHDLLVGEDGSFVRVQAAEQPVLKITHCPHHGTLFDLTRAAYHLGNRHVPIELQADHLKIEPDHVLKEMLESMHLIVHAVEESFEPENGAYGAHHSNHSDHADHAHHSHHTHAEHNHQTVHQNEQVNHDHEHGHGHH
jgi:urease accessory protein